MMTFFKGLLGKIVVLVASLAMMGVNALAMFPIIGGRTTQAISDAYPNLFTPIGSTFSIWGLIYLALLLFAIFQFGKDEKHTNEEGVQALARVRLLYTISCVLNIAWLFLWQFNQIPFTVVLMLGLLLCLIAIMRTLNKVRVQGLLGFLLKAAFGLYLGWITVATIANITVFLVYLGWNGGGLAPQWWTVGILAVGTLIGCSATVYFKNPAYGLVLLWAFWGILQQHLPSGIFAGQYPAIITTLVICMVLFVIDTLVATVLALRQRKLAPQGTQ